MIAFPRHVAIRHRAGEVIGGIGVSGSRVESDRIVAETGAAAG